MGHRAHQGSWQCVLYTFKSKELAATLQACPDVDNLYEFHFVVEGAPETVYEGGFYHGMLRFPPEYPMKVSSDVCDLACVSELTCPFAASVCVHVYPVWEI